MQKKSTLVKSGVVLSVVVSMFLMGCSDEKSVNETQKQVEKEVLVPATKVATKTADLVEEKMEKVEQKAEVAEKEVEKKVEAVEEKVEQKVETIKEEIVAVVEQKTGADIYKTCASCHGQKAEKVAMGKSAVIQGWDVSKTVAALQGYKDGSYGGAMKTLMKGQASKLSDEDMKRVAEYISKL
jgi:cytochrome c553